MPKRIDKVEARVFVLPEAYPEGVVCEVKTDGENNLLGLAFYVPDPEAGPDVPPKTLLRLSPTDVIGLRERLDA